jgi:hypothetical protein
MKTIVQLYEFIFNSPCGGAWTGGRPEQRLEGVDAFRERVSVIMAVS